MKQVDASVPGLAEHNNGYWIREGTYWKRTRGSTGLRATGKDLPFTWTGSTNFEETEQYKETLDASEDEHRPQQSLRAKGVRTPIQPTPQEREENELTYLP